LAPASQPALFFAGRRLAAVRRARLSACLPKPHDKRRIGRIPHFDDDPLSRSTAVPKLAGGTTPPRGLWVGYACAALGATLFSTKAIIIKLAYAEGINAETLLALRMALSLPVYAAIGALAVIERVRHREALPEARLVVKAGAVGLLGYWLASYTDFLGLVYISAQFERLILFTYPAFVVVFGALFFGQPIRARTVVGILISYCGLLLIFATKLNVLGPEVAKGAGLVLVAAISFALYQLLAKGFIAHIGPRLFTCIAMSAAAAAALIQFALTQPLGTLLVGPQLLGYGLLLAIGATVLPSFLLNAALHRISAQANATISTLSPVVTILLAVAILGETITWIDASGTALVLAGVGWFTLGDRKR
jgi:drug/metabolite transporter (DMT)-like permease